MTVISRYCHREKNKTKQNKQQQQKKKKPKQKAHTHRYRELLTGDCHREAAWNSKQTIRQWSGIECTSAANYHRLRGLTHKSEFCVPGINADTFQGWSPLCVWLGRDLLPCRLVVLAEFSSGFFVGCQGGRPQLCALPWRSPATGSPAQGTLLLQNQQRSSRGSERWGGACFQVI